jgi:hypothetical protein
MLEGEILEKRILKEALKFFFFLHRKQEATKQKDGSTFNHLSERINATPKTSSFDFNAD